jgi:hypothetical protein
MVIIPVVTLVGEVDFKHALIVVNGSEITRFTWGMVIETAPKIA